jgi:outer membrane protein OmpA-like peptidoglycan-associated protein
MLTRNDLDNAASYARKHQRFRSLHVTSRRSRRRKRPWVDLTKKSIEHIISLLAVLLWCLSSSCVSHEQSTPKGDPARDDLSIYRVTNDQAGHEFVKTEQFLVPVGSVVVIKGLEFEPGTSDLTARQKLIVQQVFNSLEEITENTVGDTNAARVAEYRKMEFEIRGYPDSEEREVNPALAEERAKAVLDLLTYLGTPAWRLKARGLTDKQRLSRTAGKNFKNGSIEFVRTR